MRKPKINMKPIPVALFVVTFIVASATARAQATSNTLTTSPAIIRYEPDHEQAFWVTNKTDKRLSAVLATIEVKTGSDLRNDTGLDWAALYFTKSSGSQVRKEAWLEPHEAGYGTLPGRAIPFPKDGVWRARISISEELSGREREEAIANAKKALPGKTELNSPKTSELKFWGHHQFLYSNEVRQ
jgi:hypothetical protein